MHPSDYGPFAPVVGYAGAIMATGAALFSLWGGRMEKWRPPDEDLPGGAQAVVLLLCGVGMVLQWYLASPEAIQWFLAGVVILGIATVVCYLRYTNLLGMYVFTKNVVTSENSVVSVRILGGRALRANTEEKLAQEGVDTQALLEGAAYNPDLLWTRESRQWVKQRVVGFFILMLVFGTAALTGASFATQVLLTKKAAASVIQNADAPGLKHESR